MVLAINSKVKLNNGIEIPYIGLGTYAITSEKKVIDSVMSAFEAGYRHIDTASIYGNEREIGKAIKESSVQREEIFITTKLWNDQNGYKQAFKAFEDSLKKLNTDYIDLYLIHWPMSKKRIETWKALTELVETGKCRAIGVSNYTIKHLNELFQHSNVVPAVNQVEFNPFVYHPELLKFCNQHNIQLVAYTPLARSDKFKHLLIQDLSKKYSKTPAQIMLRWSLQHSVVVIPKSANRQRIFENADVFDFEIADNDMKKMNGLDESYHLSMNPAEID